jgi:hypothetical protein
MICFTCYCLWPELNAQKVNWGVRVPSVCNNFEACDWWMRFMQVILVGRCMFTFQTSKKARLAPGSTVRDRPIWVITEIRQGRQKNMNRVCL